MISQKIRILTTSSQI